MKHSKAMIAFAAFLITCSNAYAESDQTKASMQTQSTEAQINVVRNTNDQQELLYSGPLSGYENGAYSGFDLERNNFLLLFDWERPSDEAIFIFPAGQPMTTLSTNAAPLAESDESEPFRLQNALDHIDSTGSEEKKIYNIDLLPENYLEQMRTLDLVHTGGGESPSPAPTVSYNYRISGINLRDSEDAPADRLQNGGALQSVTVKSNGANDDVILAVAEYNGYTLKKLTSYEITLDQDQDVVMTNYSLSGLTEDSSIKLFVWDAYWGTEPQANPVMLFPENEIDTNIQFLYDQAYSEKSLQKGQTILAQACMRSTAWWPQQASLYVALYDETGALTAVSRKHDTISSNGEYQKLAAELAIPENLPDGARLKAFLWNGQTMNPYQSCEIITSAEDSYSDTISDANFFDLAQPISGSINTPGDVDCMKIIPSKTGDYLLQLTGNETLSLKLYQEDGTLLSENSFYTAGTGRILKNPLEKGRIYYIEISGQESDSYTLTVNQNRASMDRLEISGNQIRLSGFGKGGEAYQLALLTPNGSTLAAQALTAGETGAYEAALSAPSENGTYYVMLLQGNRAKKLWRINITRNQITWNGSEDEYLSIPIYTSGAAAPDGIIFSVAYDSESLALFDACELTEAAETTPMTLADEKLQIISIRQDGLSFCSTKNEPQTEDQLINIIKLRAKQNGTKTVSVCAYTAE